MYMYGMMPGDQMPGTLHPYGKTQWDGMANKVMGNGMPYGGKLRPGVAPGPVTPGGAGPGVAPGGLAPGGYVPGAVTPVPTERPMRGEAVRPRPEPGATGVGREGLVQRLEAYMKDQVTAAAFYRELEEAADDARVKEYLRHAREDEQKHYRLLRRRYQALTGRPYEAAPTQVTYASLTDGLFKAIDGEIEAFEEYRDEYLRQTEQQDRQLFFELMTDEIEHATRFNTALHILRS